MKDIKNILISTLVPMENHIANGGEKLLGNASSIKKMDDGRVYISGQMQRNALFKAIERLNWVDDNRGSTYVSNGDGIGNAIEVDLRADMGGFMHPRAGNYTGRRTSPIGVTPAVALEPSRVSRDMLLKLRTLDREHSIATREFSEHDLMVMNFSLDVSCLSISKRFEYDNEFHVNTNFIKHVKETERQRRVRLFLQGTQSLHEYANQARNAVSGEPRQVLIVFDTKLSRKACRYFQANETEKKNILEELAARNAKHFLGNDVTGETSVYHAYEQALTELGNSTLYDPCGGDKNIVNFTDAFSDLLGTEG